MSANNDSNPRSDNKPTSPYGPLQLLIVQATSFCNLDCSYCYLPDRQNKSKLDLDIFRLALSRVYESNLADGTFTVVWHAGEPLAAGLSFYQEALKISSTFESPDQKIRHTFQTNGTLLNNDWCDLIQKHEIKIGLSIDGPEFIHDENRMTRSGAGTYKKVKRAMDLLRERHIDYYTITVLTKNSLRHPDEIFEFFRDNSVSRIGFNLEEIEGIHKESSLSGPEAPAEVRQFFQRFYQRYLEEGRPFHVREFDQIERALRHRTYRRAMSGQQTVPFRIITVGTNGDFTTFSPELLTMKSDIFSDFVIGNVKTSSFEEAYNSFKLRAIQNDINKGISNCQSTCNYFPVCGGGSPSNKMSELGRLDGTETMHCRLRHQALPEAILSYLEANAVAPAS